MALPLLCLCSLVLVERAPLPPLFVLSTRTPPIAHHYALCTGRRQLQDPASVFCALTICTGPTADEETRGTSDEREKWRICGDPMSSLDYLLDPRIRDGGCLVVGQPEMTPYDINSRAWRANCLSPPFMHLASCDRERRSRPSRLTPLSIHLSDLGLFFSFVLTSNLTMTNRTLLS